MIQGLRTMALAGLLLAAGAVQAATPAAGVGRVHLKYGARASAATPALRSSAALVLDATHSSVLYSRRSDIAVPIASITKLMTALVMMEAGQPLDEPIEITPDDRSVRRGDVSRLAPGTTPARGELLHLALTASEHQASHALARADPGGLADRVAAMA